jgi:two-component system OmpR family response regulator
MTLLQPTRITRFDGSPIRALVVDDEASLSDLLQLALRYEGWDVKTAADGQQALKTTREFRPDVIVLDIMMPNVDGLQTLRRLRTNGDDVPVLFLTAKDSVDDRIVGLTSGGDDYVTKPFSLEEVVARLRGLLRRTARVVGDDDSPELTVGDLVLNEESYEVRRGDTDITLTATEFELLRFLMRNPRRVLSKEQILDRV